VSSTGPASPSSVTLNRSARSINRRSCACIIVGPPTWSAQQLLRVRALLDPPGAQILELGKHGIRATDWDDLQIVDHWRRYLANPEVYLPCAGSSTTTADPR
jgi:hypothetical protein